MPPAALIILERRVIPPGLLRNSDSDNRQKKSDIKPYFFNGELDGLGANPKEWPADKEQVLRRILAEGMLVQPSAKHKQVRSPVVVVASAPPRQARRS